MLYSSRFFAALAAAFLISAAAAQDDPNQRFTAKELYLRSRQLPYHATPAPEQPAKVEAPPAKSVPVVKPPAKSPATAAKSTTVSSPTPHTTSTPASTPAKLPDGGRIVPAAATAPAPAQGPALGLRYSILRRTNGEMMEVPKDTEFHTGDAIQIKVQTNSPGYLYIVNQGSSGAWAPMFPSTDFQGGDNKVDGWHTYMLPPRAMVFDERTGVEKLTVLFAREPEPDFENLIYSLQAAQTAKPAAHKTGETPKPADSGSKTLVASAGIGDDVVRNKRQMYSRDLVVETVTPSTPGEQKEYADYVVNPTGASDSRVIADLKLVHK